MKIKLSKQKYGFYVKFRVVFELQLIIRYKDGIFQMNSGDLMFEEEKSKGRLFCQSKAYSLKSEKVEKFTEGKVHFCVKSVSLAFRVFERRIL